MRKAVYTSDVPGVGPYSQAVKGGRLIFRKRTACP